MVEGVGDVRILVAVIDGFFKDWVGYDIVGVVAGCPVLERVRGRDAIVVIVIVIVAVGIGICVVVIGIGIAIVGI